jgi:hypothetical protein
MTDRAILAPRVSTKAQDESNQLPDLEGYALEQGYEVVQVVSIKASASKGLHLEELYAAIAMIAGGLADVLILWTADRLSRQGLEAALDLRRRVREAGGRLEFSEDPELSGMGNDVDEAFGKQATDARRETEKRMKRTSRGHARAVANNAAVRRPRYGWTLTGPKRHREWVISEPAATVMRGVFQRAADGQSLRQIMAWARTQDTSRKWEHAELRRMIADTAYHGRDETSIGTDVALDENGVMGFVSEVYVYECPAIVTIELWSLANVRIGEPKRYVKPAVTPYAGIIYCSACDRVMRRTSAGTGSGRRYWRCQQGHGSYRYESTTSRIHQALSSITAQLYKEEIVKSLDTRDARLKVLKAEQENIGRHGYSVEKMIQRLQEIQSKVAEIEAEVKPRGRIERTPLETSLGEAYTALDHNNAVAVNQWLKEQNIRITLGDVEAELWVLRKMGINDAYSEPSGEPGEPGMVITWHLTEENL